MRIITLVFALLFFFGCAEVQVKAPKEPIKVDIAMRVDVYQHIEKDIDAVESIVSGGQARSEAKPVSLLDGFMESAYAQDGLDPGVEKAALSRKARYDELSSWEQKGVIGENRIGLIEVRDASRAGASVDQLVRDENRDRMIIYELISKKNGAGLSDVQKLYAKRLQRDAPGGTPIEVIDDSTGAASWEIK